MPSHRTSEYLRLTLGLVLKRRHIVLSVPWAKFRSSASGYRKGNRVDSPAPAGEVGPDLTFAWKLARNIDVRAFPADDEQVTQEALHEHPRLVRSRGWCRC